MSEYQSHHEPMAMCKCPECGHVWYGSIMRACPVCPVKDEDAGEWVDITYVGSAYEEQIEARSNRHRYRPLKLTPVKLFEEKGVGEWVYGPCPTEG